MINEPVHYGGYVKHHTIPFLEQASAVMGNKTVRMPSQRNVTLESSL